MSVDLKFRLPEDDNPMGTKAELCSYAQSSESERYRFQ